MSKSNIRVAKDALAKIFGPDLEIKEGSCEIQFDEEVTTMEKGNYPLHEKRELPKPDDNPRKYYMVYGLALGIEILDPSVELSQLTLYERIAYMLIESKKTDPFYLEKPVYFLSCLSKNDGHKEDNGKIILLLKQSIKTMYLIGKKQREKILRLVLEIESEIKASELIPFEITEKTPAEEQSEQNTI